jgi:hypothetical protein
MVHGGGFKPDRDSMETLWREALAVGLDRDFREAGGRALLDGVRIEFAYYADLVNPLLAGVDKLPDATLDLADRRQGLAQLTALSGRKSFRRIHYEALPGKSAFGEFVADVGLPVLTALRLADPVLARRLPALAAYLSGSPEFRDACESRLLETLAPRLAGGEELLLLSHGMGSVLCYDALWRLSHDPAVPAGHVGTWITFGTPLASEYVKRRLRGAGEPLDRRYPRRLINWFNVSAEDDYYCHDKTVADDFAAMLKARHLSRIKDYYIYNLTLRHGRSNPHSAVGYLVHPRITELVADWLGGTA